MMYISGMLSPRGAAVLVLRDGQEGFALVESGGEVLRMAGEATCLFDAVQMAGGLAG